MTRLTTLTVAALVAGGALGCGLVTQDDDALSGDVPADEAPPVPAIGQQIDRAGRDGINHAATDPFGLQELFSHQIRDTYNHASDRAQWTTLFEGRIRFALSTWDGVDGVCGNQLAAGAAVEPARYDRLVALIADDVLLVDSSKATCDAYWAVEQRILDVDDAGAEQCGGRHPLMDTPDITMSYFAAGLDGRIGDATWKLDDGISSDGDGAVSLTEFPFLLPPGIGSPQAATPGTIDPMQSILTCSALGETRCNRVYACWGRDGLPDGLRAAYNYRIDDCVRQYSSECRGVSTTHFGPTCPAGMLLDPEKVRACERIYALATCDQIQAAGAAMLECGDMCVTQP